MQRTHKTIHIYIAELPIENVLALESDKYIKRGGTREREKGKSSNVYINAAVIVKMAISVLFKL